jgi:hypothetical protein
MTNEKEFIEYVKLIVHFNKNTCSVLCSFYVPSSYTTIKWCSLFDKDITNLRRSSKCKKYFND